MCIHVYVCMEGSHPLLALSPTHQVSNLSSHALGLPLRCVPVRAQLAQCLLHPVVRAFQRDQALVAGGQLLLKGR